MKQVLRITTNNDFNKYIKKIQFFLSDLVYEYPLHDIWFAGVVKELKYNKNEREILFIVSDDEIVGVSILKKTKYEKKICTIRVASNFQRKGLGTLLVEKSCEFLETRKPIITVSESKHPQFIKLFKHFNFNLEKKYYGKYCAMSTEYCYNGILLPETILKKEKIDEEMLETRQIA